MREIHLTAELPDQAVDQLEGKFLRVHEHLAVAAAIRLSLAWDATPVLLKDSARRERAALAKFECHAAAQLRRLIDARR